MLILPFLDLDIKEIIIRIVSALLIVLLMQLLDATCIFRYITGYPCPACGVTRALKSLARGDVLSYVRYNAFALPLAFSVFIIFFSKYLKKWVIYIAYTILVLNLIYFVYRLFFSIIP